MYPTQTQADIHIRAARAKDPEVHSPTEPARPLSQTSLHSPPNNAANSSEFMPGDPGGFVVPMSVALNAQMGGPQSVAMSFASLPPMGYPPQQPYPPQQSYPPQQPYSPQQQHYPHQQQWGNQGSFGLPMALGPGGFMVPGSAPQLNYAQSIVSRNSSVYSHMSQTPTSPSYPPVQQQTLDDPPPYSPSIATSRPTRHNSVSSQYSYQPVQNMSITDTTYNPFTQSSSTLYGGNSQQQQNALNWDNVQWAPYNQGFIPEEALVAGTNNGELVYVGRGVSRGKTVVGMSTKKLTGILVNQNGAPAMIRPHETLCMPEDRAVWVQVSAPFRASELGRIPVVAAHDNASGMMYIARKRTGGFAYISGTKEGDAEGIAFICYGKPERAVDFEILCI